jgi:hypothetical protein
VAVPADEIFVYGPHSIRRRNKTAYGKKEVTRNFNPASESAGNKQLL